ncbi:uncharacterized protein [Littorina saxatilis]|uniref:uncharacterized protein n=1 Tax=Littorina saxatilis TaxID=31220 RepID=UPI0038B64BF6
MSLRHAFPLASLHASSIIPARDRSPLNDLISPSNSNLAAVCERLGVQLVNSTPIFQTANGAPRLALYRDRIHPSPKGTARLAETLFPFQHRPPRQTISRKQHGPPPKMASKQDGYGQPSSLVNPPSHHYEAEYPPLQQRDQQWNAPPFISSTPRHQDVTPLQQRDQQWNAPPFISSTPRHRDVTPLQQRDQQWNAPPFISSTPRHHDVTPLQQRDQQWNAPPFISSTPRHQDVTPLQQRDQQWNVPPFISSKPRHQDVTPTLPPGHFVSHHRPSPPPDFRAALPPAVAEAPVPPRGSYFEEGDYRPVQGPMTGWRLSGV